MKYAIGSLVALVSIASAQLLSVPQCAVYSSITLLLETFILISLRYNASFLLYLATPVPALWTSNALARLLISLLLPLVSRKIARNSPISLPLSMLYAPSAEISEFLSRKPLQCSFSERRQL